MGMFICVPRAHHDTARMSQAGTLIVYKQFKKLQELPTDSFVNPFYTMRQARVCAALMNVPQRSTLLQQMVFFWRPLFPLPMIMMTSKVHVAITH
jgi:hypothetical protein